MGLHGNTSCILIKGLKINRIHSASLTTKHVKSSDSHTGHFTILDPALHKGMTHVEQKLLYQSLVVKILRLH